MNAMARDERRRSPRRVLTGPAARNALTVGVVVAVSAGVPPRIADHSAARDLGRGLTAVEVTGVVSWLTRRSGVGQVHSADPVAVRS